MLDEFPIYLFTCISDALAARQDYNARINAATTAAIIKITSWEKYSDVGSKRTRIHGI